MIEFTLLVITLLSASSAGSFILRKLRAEIPSPLASLIFASTLGLGALSYLVLFVGLAGGFYSWVGFLVLVSPLLIFRSDLSRNLTSLADLTPRIPRWIAALPLGGKFLVGLLAIEVTVNMIASYAPPTEVDTLVYHLAVPKLWIESHRISYLPSHYFGNLPFNMEMLYSLGMLVSSSALAQLIHTVFGIILVVSVYVLGRYYLQPAWSLLAAAVFYAITDVSGQSATAMIDLGLATYSLLGFWAFWLWTRSRSREWLLLAGLFSGLAAGTKLPSALVAVWLGLLELGISLWLHKESITTSARRFVAFGAISFGLVLPWYLKSWVLAGNPFYPLFYNIFGGRDLSSAGVEIFAKIQQGSSGTGQTFWGLLKVPWDLTIVRHSFGGEIGPLFLAILPVALLGYRRLWDWWVGLLFGGGLVAILYWTVLRVRWLLPVLALASIAVAVTMFDWRKTSRLLFATMVVAAVLWLTVGLIGDLRFHGRALPVALRLEPREEYLMRTLNAERGEVSYADYQAMNAMLPRDSKVLLLETRGYYLERDYVLGRGLVYGMLPLDALNDPAKLFTGLRGLGVTHVYEPLLVRDYEPFLGEMVPILLASGKAREVYRSESGLVVALDEA